tara:strand:- start:958 stop:1665 length:708 start_codon:yes stop_codon:yes gene_type:complete
MKVLNQFSILFISIFSIFKGNSMTMPYKYPYDPRIHNFGNVGFGGKIHASLARPITKLIDIAAYSGEDIRDIIVNNLKDDVKTVSDWCCGTGMSTDALRKKFKNSDIIAVDTSHEMLDVARRFSTSKANFIWGDAENVKLPNPVDLITIMFAFHEIPQHGRLKILENARENLSENGKVLVVDIDMAYKPSRMMLSGEPYVLDYIKNIRSDIMSIFPIVQETVEVPGHVRQWLLSK